MYARERKYNKNRTIEMRVFYGLVLCNDNNEENFELLQEIHMLHPLMLVMRNFFKEAARFPIKPLV